MDINISRATSLFFPQSSFEWVYFEAIANAIDAGATSINLTMNIDEPNNVDGFYVEIDDNGKGFTDKNFAKFSKLMEVDSEDHKGLGRLVYLKYFEEVAITSLYENSKREFVFSDTFEGDSKETSEENERETGYTYLKFKSYRLKKLATYDYIRPDFLKKALEQHFAPKLYDLKMQNKELVITIKLKITKPNHANELYSTTSELSVQKLPDLKCKDVQIRELSLLPDDWNMKLYYNIQSNCDETVIKTSVGAEGRTIPLELINKNSIPSGYKVFFLLYADYFNGKVSNSREKLNISEDELKILKRNFTKEISIILSEEIPDINIRNSEAVNFLQNKYPHLEGYFDNTTTGLIDRSKAVESAQKKFFLAQKEILEADELDDEKYEKSLELSSRVLTEYILYRSFIIGKLKDINKDNSEKEIHDLIVPTRKTLRNKDYVQDLYNNNAWLLDDKYMGYQTILSDKDMDALVKELSEEDEGDESRPDIAIVFSKDPETTEKVDVVIIELKKKELKLAKKEEVISQLKQRARRLLEYYPNKIQRIWFYGIVDFDVEFIIHLREEKYTALYSNDKVYYKDHTIIPLYDPTIEIPVGLHVLSFDAFLEDAEVRNNAFLEILKNSFKKKPMHDTLLLTPSHRIETEQII